MRGLRYCDLKVKPNEILRLEVEVDSSTTTILHELIRQIIVFIGIANKALLVLSKNVALQK